MLISYLIGYLIIAAIAGLAIPAVAPLVGEALGNYWQERSAQTEYLRGKVDVGYSNDLLVIPSISATIADTKFSNYQTDADTGAFPASPSAVSYIFFPSYPINLQDMDYAFTCQSIPEVPMYFGELVVPEYPDDHKQAEFHFDPDQYAGNFLSQFKAELVPEGEAL